jgi:Flp pilus assembly protein TadD
MLACVLATLALFCPEPTSAQSAVQARFLDEAARGAYARGDYEAALADFFELARIAPSQGTLYNVAICAELTHRDALAFDALEIGRAHV